MNSNCILRITEISKAAPVAFHRNFTARKLVKGTQNASKKWRTQEDSNLWPLPSEGSALSSWAMGAGRVRLAGITPLRQVFFGAPFLFTRLLGRSKSFWRPSDLAHFVHNCVGKARPRPTKPPRCRLALNKMASNRDDGFKWSCP